MVAMVRMTDTGKPSFWTTLPGIMTALAALLTASTGLYLAVRDSPTDAGVRPAADTADRTAGTDGAMPAAPAFVRMGSMPADPPVEYELQRDGLPLTDAPGFLRVTEFAFGSADGGGSPDMFKVELVLTNTAADPIRLDLTDRYFSLEDDRGRRAELVYFCCEAHGTLLPPGQSRTAGAFFTTGEWYGKEVAARVILFRVQGLLPIERATWRFPVLATAAD
jgi:hypothetical protein